MVTKYICSNVNFLFNENTNIISKIDLNKLPKLYKKNFFTYDLSFASTETKFIKPKTKTQNNIVIFGFFLKKLCYYFGFC